MSLVKLLLAFFLAAIISAKTHRYEFNITYVNANPDGLHERRVIGVNGAWPPPEIRVKKHDKVLIQVNNQIDRDTSLHFHGLFQKGSNAMDGPQMTTQCPIVPNHSFLYDFSVGEQTGTYWYHAHSGAEYGDGLRGLFIIEDEDSDLVYDEEVSFTMSEWYHEETPALVAKLLSRYNPQGNEPIPDSALFNESHLVKWNVDKGKTYLVRFVNVGLFVSQFIEIEDHSMTIVEIDGVRVKPYEVDSLYIAVAQRYAVLIHTKNYSSKNFRLINTLDIEMLDSLPDELRTVSTNWVVYNEKKQLPPPLKNDFSKAIQYLSPVDDIELEPLKEIALFDEPDYQMTLNVTMENLGDGVKYAMFNGRTYVTPRVPTLMTALSSENFASEQKIYGSNTNSFILQENEVIEIILNNHDDGKHPFHLHGHIFQVLSRSEDGDEEPIDYNPNHDHKFPQYPMMRDTVMVNGNGYIVLRFKADNPGIWLFHCHVDWHLEQGLSVTFIEAPTLLTNQSLSKNHIDACIAANVPYIGNAAGNQGNETDWYDLTGEFLQPKPLPEGFTLKGYVAFAICALLGIYGLYTIYEYGINDISEEDIINIERLQEYVKLHGSKSERQWEFSDERADHNQSEA